VIQIFIFFLKAIRYIYRKIASPTFINQVCISDRQISNDIIYKKLLDSNPLMISRFGTTELITLNNYICISSNISLFKKIKNYIFDNTHLPWWDISHFKYLDLYSGVFPRQKKTIITFCERYISDIPNIDLLGSFQYFEKFMPLNSRVINLHLETLYPFFVENPWTRILENKKVLVIHPFVDSIKKQYENREYIFNNKNILPEFELILLKSIQSAGGNSVSFKNWLDALHFMESQIDKIDFDICLLGCGAYGLPLASYIKRKGKKSIHLGGGLQLLFGIKGSRWDNPNYGVNYSQYKDLMKHPYSSLYNKYWIRPLASDSEPLLKIDGGQYW